MIVNVSAVVLLGLVLLLLVRVGRLALLDLVLCAVFGFLLADGPLAATIHHLVGWVTNALAVLRL
jgi:hypothetical protein